MAWPSAKRSDASWSAISECKSKLSKWLIRSLVKYGRVIERWNLFELARIPLALNVLRITGDVLPHITYTSGKILNYTKPKRLLPSELNTPVPRKESNCDCNIGPGGMDQPKELQGDNQKCCLCRTHRIGLRESPRSNNL